MGQTPGGGGSHIGVTGGPQYRGRYTQCCVTMWPSTIGTLASTAECHVGLYCEEGMGRFYGTIYLLISEV